MMKRTYAYVEVLVYVVRLVCVSSVSLRANTFTVYRYLAVHLKSVVMSRPVGCRMALKPLTGLHCPLRVLHWPYESLSFSVLFVRLRLKVGSYDDFFRTLWYYMLYQRVRVAYGGEFHFFC